MKEPTEILLNLLPFIFLMTELFIMKIISLILKFICAFWRILLSVLSVLLKLISCIDVGNVKVHFFYGEKECFDYVWYLALLGIIIVN